MEERETAAPETAVEETEEQTAHLADDTTTDSAAVDGGSPDPSADAEEKGEESQQTGSEAEETAKPTRTQKRIDTLTSRNHRLQEENARLRREMAAAEKELTELKAPNEDDFDTEEAFRQAQIEHAVDRRTLEKQRENANRTFQSNEQEREEERRRIFSASTAEFKQTTPDYDQVVDAANIPVSQAMADAITSNENGARLLYELSKQPEIAMELVQMTPLDMAYALGKFEAGLGKPSAPQPKPVSKAPPPVKPLKPGETPVAGNIYELPTKDFLKARIEQLRKG